jgi:hypothetical protein
MSSPVYPIRDPGRFDVMFWLPPGGTDNGVWASAWAELADLGADDIDAVLGLLADADVGGYVATPGGVAHTDTDSNRYTGYGWIRCDITGQKTC